MALIAQLADDIDGTISEDVATKKFEFEGSAYEIDLSETNQENLRAALEAYGDAVKTMQHYIDHARKIKAAKAPRKSQSGSESPTDKVRAWARENGMEVSDKGRVPKVIQDAYEEAHSEKETE